MGPVTLENKSLMVSDLLCPLTNKWELDKIRVLLPQYEDTILQIKTSSTPVEDTLLWLPEKSGTYSTKIGYGIPMAGGEESHPKEVWRLIPTQHTPSSLLPSVSELIKQGSNFIPLPPTGLTSPLWPWVLWNLWKAKNKLVFENRVFTTQEIALKSIKDAKEWSEAQANTRMSSSPHPSSIRPNQRSPCPPPPVQTEVLICKVDVAWDSSSRKCGIGRIFSGNAAVSLPSISDSHSHVSSALMAEAIAVHRAVALTFYSNVRSLADELQTRVNGKSKPGLQTGNGVHNVIEDGTTCNAWFCSIIGYKEVKKFIHTVGVR
ncbi:hypothetical protein F2Q69_00047453 [Brassica cretica]|uniref:RNase H type-1 domain-containing protein n=1 Tax=Brassica cretica TaxID=69181 RepID=A0A8S9PNH2_BRACR|nr:hypothetical protein F2Q69_00047453 [Brassica cretica]